MSNLKGYLFAAIAAASYGTNPIFAIPLYHEGISVSSVLFMRYAMAVAIMFVFTMIKSPKSLIIKPKHIGVLAFMGILMVLSSIGLFASYKYLSAGIASTLLFFYYTTPISALIHLCDREPEKTEEALAQIEAFSRHFISTCSAQITDNRQAEGRLSPYPRL